MPHAGHPDCIYKSKAACERARHEALGRCVELTQDKRQPKPCSHWAESIVDKKPVCNQHATVLLNRLLEQQRRLDRINKLNARIDAHLAWVRDHPHVWDRKPV
jgi:hypothetical protein